MRQKKAVESKLANFLRDISEVRKTGLAPEKTIEQLAGRQYSGLTPHIQRISSQLSWGTSMRTVLENFGSVVRSWLTRAMAFLLLEVVDVGGGSTKMFTDLADFTEKNALLQQERRSMVRPYLMIPYIGAIMVVATTAMMLYFVNPPGLSAAGIPALASPGLVAKEATNILLLCAFFQAWVMGFVAGKMGEESAADGFKHATFLVVLSLVTVYVSLYLINGISAKVGVALLRSKRALSTAIFLLLIMLASTAIYYINSETVGKEVVIRNVFGNLNSNGAKIALGFSYPAASNGLIFFRQGETFYVFLYLSGNGTIQSVTVTTQGFNESMLAPPLPLTIDNYTEPSVIILGITAMRCCFNGTVDFTVNAT